MVSRNDLSAYKKSGDEKPVLAEATPARKRGVKAKPAAERRSEKVLLSLTPAERESVEAKAGMVPVATWLMAELRARGVFE